MELLKRVIIAAIFIPVLLWIYFTGGLILTVLLGALCALSSFELLKMFEKKSVKLLFFNIVLSFALFYSISQGLPYSLIIIFFVLLFNGAKDVFLSCLDGSVQRISGALLAVIYPAIGFGLLYRLGDFHNTLIPVLAILIWITDSFAYFVGMSMGRHRGFFKCSPKKSIEGFVAGIVFAFIGSFIAHKLFPQIYLMKHVVMLTVATGIFGQFGDLFESVLKRDFQTKDSSQLIPGHGGVLDRFDSLLVSAPIMYILLMLF